MKTNMEKTGAFKEPNQLARTSFFSGTQTYQFALLIVAVDLRIAYRRSRTAIGYPLSNLTFPMRFRCEILSNLVFWGFRSSGGLLDSVHELLALQKQRDLLMAVEPPPAALSRLAQLEHHRQARAA